MTQKLMAPVGEPTKTFTTWDKLLNSVGPAMRSTMADRAAQHLRSGNATQATKNALESAVSDMRIPVKGYRKSAVAPAGPLGKCIAQNLEIGGDPRLASATARAWAESEPELRERTWKFLAVRNNTPRPIAHEFDPDAKLREEWPMEILASHWRDFMKDHEDQGYQQDEVMTMSICLTLQAPQAPGQEVSVNDWERRLQAMVDNLRGIQATSEVWDRAIPRFGQAILDLIDEKIQERTLTGELGDITRRLRTQRRHQLEFFEAEYLRWIPANLQYGVPVKQAMDAVLELDSLIENYEEYHAQGSTFTEEARRAETRARLATEIMAAIERMNQAMHGPEGPPDHEQEEEEGDGDAPQARQEETSEAPVQEENEQLFSIEEYEQLESENQRMAEELRMLQANLANAEESGEYWRELAHSASEARSAEAEEENAPKSAAEAVERAKREFPDELLIALNSQSEVENNPFIRPDEIRRALTWLVQGYRGSRIGELKITDYNLSVKEACGWTYKASQSDSTMGKHREEYRTRVGGRTHVLREHIGKGTSKDPRHTIRIAFDFDRRTRKVIVGYIGVHQPSKAS